MGYSTYITIQIVHRRKVSREREKKAFETIINHAEPCSCCLGDDECSFEDNNCSTLNQIVEYSKHFPFLLMEASGNGDEYDDIWCMRIRGGKAETVRANICYAPFRELLNAQEKEAADWKASRSGKGRKAYDRRIAKALRILQDLCRNAPACTAHNGLHEDLVIALDRLETVKRHMYELDAKGAGQVCPHCGSPNIECLAEDDHCGTPWHCHECDTWFETPNEG
jgi:hypothetical protein